MRIYLACVNGSFLEYIRALDYPHVLFSYAYLRKSKQFQQQAQYYTGNVIVDSGAYSVWTQGQQINLQEYIDFCLYFQRVSRAREIEFVNLDVIPWTVGQRPTQKHILQAVQQGLENLRHMRAAGIQAVPVFHQGEPLEVLSQLLEDLLPGTMIGLSSRFKYVTPEGLRFLDHSFTILKDAIIHKRVRPHLLGMTSHKVLTRYPVFSADVATFSRGSGYGATTVFRDGQMISFHYRNLHRHSPSTLAAIEGLTKKKGFYQRAILAIQSYKTYEEYLTALWQAKGFSWPAQQGEASPQ